MPRQLVWRPDWSQAAPSIRVRTQICKQQVSAPPAPELGELVGCQLLCPLWWRRSLRKQLAGPTHPCRPWGLEPRGLAYAQTPEKRLWGPSPRARVPPGSQLLSCAPLASRGPSQGLTDPWRGPTNRALAAPAPLQWGAGSLPGWWRESWVCSQLEHPCSAPPRPARTARAWGTAPPASGSSWSCSSRAFPSHSPPWTRAGETPAAPLPGLCPPGPAASLPPGAHRALDVLKDFAPGSQLPILLYDGDAKTDTLQIQEFLEETLGPPE